MTKFLTCSEKIFFLAIIRNAKTTHLQLAEVSPLTYSTPPKNEATKCAGSLLAASPSGKLEKDFRSCGWTPLSSLWLLEAPPADVQAGKASFQVGRIFPPSAT